MDEYAISWICRIWANANSRRALLKLSDKMHGAGMAVCGFDYKAASDYWTLSDLAYLKALEVGYDD